MRVLPPFCGAVILALGCAQAQGMTLNQAIQATLDHHPQLRADLNDRLSAQQEQKVAKGGYMPTVDLTASYGRERTDSPTTRSLGHHNTETLNYTESELRLRQMLFDGFNTSSEIGRSNAVANSRAYYAQAAAQDLALRTIEVYLDVLKRRELVGLAKNNMQAHLRINDQIGLRSQHGVGSNADLDQSQARRALAENNFYTEQANLADAEANFYSAVGVMPDELEMPPSAKTLMPSSLEDARQETLQNNPYLKSAEADVQAAEKQYEGAKSPFYPHFSAELSAGLNNNLQGEQGHYNAWGAAVVMNYNLFNGNRDKSRLQSSSYKIDQARDIRNNALRMINENTALAWNAMNNARTQTPKALEYATSTSKVRGAYLDQFGLGKRTLLDLLDSENELFTANQRYTDLRYTEEYSMYRVVAATGQLLQKEKVVLPAEAIADSDVQTQARLPDMK